MTVEELEEEYASLKALSKEMQAETPRSNQDGEKASLDKEWEFQGGREGVKSFSIASGQCWMDHDIFQLRVSNVNTSWLRYHPIPLRGDGGEKWKEGV